MTPVSRILAWLASFTALLAVPWLASACLAAAAAENTVSSSSLSEASVPQGDDMWDLGVEAPDPGSSSCPPVLACACITPAAAEVQLTVPGNGTISANQLLRLLQHLCCYVWQRMPAI